MQQQCGLTQDKIRWFIGNLRRLLKEKATKSWGDNDDLSWRRLNRTEMDGWMRHTNTLGIFTWRVIIAHCPRWEPGAVHFRVRQLELPGTMWLWNVLIWSFKASTSFWIICVVTQGHCSLARPGDGSRFTAVIVGSNLTSLVSFYGKCGNTDYHVTHKYVQCVTQMARNSFHKRAVSSSSRHGAHNTSTAMAISNHCVMHYFLCVIELPMLNHNVKSLICGQWRQVLMV